MKNVTPKKSRLDSVGEIRLIDKSNVLQFCVDAPKHYNEAYNLAQRIAPKYSRPDNIIVAGMGGSAIGGEFLKDYVRNHAIVPVEVSKDYTLPAYANERSFVLVVSYSGDTEESLSAFLDAKKRGCMTFCVSCGGSLLKYAEKLGVPYLQVPKGMPPRAAFPYMLMPQLVLAEKLGLVQDLSKNLIEATQILEKVSRENSPETTTGSSVAKSLADSINGAVPVIYGFGNYRAVALRWKQQFNENAKVPAKWEVFPELDHNEIVGWENATELAECFTTVFLRDKNEPLEVRNRIEITKSLMPKVSKQFEVWSQGKSMLGKMLSTLVVGDFASVYLAVLRGVDPVPVQTINVLKRKLGETGTRGRVIRELEKLKPKS